MRTIARFMDARNTTEGKFLSVLLSVLLVFSFLNVTMFTDYAGADTTEEDGTEIVTPLEDVDEPEAQPEDEADGPESEEPAEEVNEPEPAGDEVVPENTANDASEIDAKKAEVDVADDNQQLGIRGGSSEMSLLVLDDPSVVAEAGSYTLQKGDRQTLESKNSAGRNYYHSWEASDSSVISINRSLDKESQGGDAYRACTVTAESAGTAVVTHVWYTREWQGFGLWGHYEYTPVGSETFAITVEAPAPQAARAYFYFLLPGKDSKVDIKAEDYMYAGDGSMTVPAGLGTRWYQGETHNGEKFDISKYVVEWPTDAEIRRGLQTYYNGQNGRDTYSAEWTYTYEPLVMTDERSSVGYDYKELNPSKAHHIDIQLVIDKKDRASVGYRVLEPDSSMSTRSVEHQKGTTVEINSTVSETSPFTTDGAEYEPTKQYNDKTWYFDGWYTDDSYSAKADDSISVSEPTIFYARYVTHENKLTYDAAGGEFDNGSSTVESYEASGAALTAHVAPTREGYNFEGWTGSDGLSYADRASFTMPDGNLTLTAQWSAKTTESYTVKYLEQGTNKELSSPEIRTDKIFGETYTEDAKQITGYTVDSERKSITLTTAPAVREIVFYYTPMTDLSYVVKYVDKETQKEIRSAETVSGQTFGTEVSVPAVDNIAGYNLDKTDLIPLESAKLGKKLTINSVEEAGNVVTFYYTKKADLSYTVKYVLATKSATGFVPVEPETAVIDPKVVTPVVFGSSHTVPAISLPGYEVDALSKQVTVNDGENVITFYYAKLTDLPYTVNYYKDAVAEGNLIKSDEGTGTFQAEIPWTDGKYLPEGYVTPGAVSGQQTITANAEANVLNVVYSKNTALSYQVRYFYDGVEAEDLKVAVEGKATFGDPIPYETEGGFLAYNGENYVLDRVEGAGKTVTTDASANVVEVYFDKDELKDTTDDDPKPGEPGDGVADKYQATIVYAAGENGEISAPGAHVLTLFGDNGEPAAADNVIPYHEVNVSAIPDPGYEFASWAFTSNDDQAGINLTPNDMVELRGGKTYTYTAQFGKRTDLSYEVHYYYDGIEATELAVIVEGKATFGDPIPYETEGGFLAYNGENYVLDRVEGGGKTVTTTAADNVIKVYFDKDEIGETPGQPGEPDGVADKYQATVTYHVANGAFGQGGTTSVTEVITVAEKDENGSVVPIDYAMSVPKNMVPAAGYDQQPGAWSEPMPGTETLEGGKSYDYTFTYGINVYSVTVSVANGTSNVGTVGTTGTYGSDLAYTFAPADGYALDSVTVDGQPAVLTNGGYTFSALDANHSIEVVYAIDANRDGIPDSRQAIVSYDVANGVWADGTAATITEYVDMFAYRNGEWESVEPVLNVPAGMIANTGYSQASGAWRVDPAASQLVAGGEVTFTYAFTAIPTVVVPPTTPVVPTAPVTPAAVTPATPVTPALAAPAPAAATPAPATETIEDDATPQAATPTPNEPEMIEDEATPMGAFDEPHCWVHWVMLLGILITAIYGIVVVRRRLHLVDEVNDYEKQVLGIEDEQAETVPVTGRQAL